MKKGNVFKNLRWLAVVLTLAITVTSVSAAVNPYYVYSFWQIDPLYNGPLGDTTNAQPGDSVPGYWYRDTTNQNALSQYSVDQFNDSVATLYISPTLKVYEFINNSGPNVTLIISGNDYMIVGCGGGTTAATYARNKLYYQFVGKTLRGVIMTSGNVEDIWGCKTWAQYTPTANIYASSSFDEVMEQQADINSGLTARRQMFQGTFLRWGANHFLNAGAMREFRAVQPQSLMEPSLVITGPTDITLGGNTITLTPTPNTDADGGLMVYIPGAGTAIVGEFLGHHLPDINAFNNARMSPAGAIQFLNDLITLSPSNLVYKTGLPVIGADMARAALLDQRDALQYLIDQTLAKINQGTPVDEIVATTHLPDAREDGTPLGASWYNQEYASDQASIIRWIYSYHMGWFGGEPVELADTLTSAAQGQILADAYGGLEALTAAALQAELAASDQASAEKALYLAYSAYKLAPSGSFEVNRIYAQALRKIAWMQKSAYKRNYYLATADNLGSEKKVSDITRTGQEDTAVSFTWLEFIQHFISIPETNLIAIKIISLPENGTLSLPDGAITAGQEISRFEMEGLVFTPAENWNGTTSFLWNGYDGFNYTETTANVTLTIDPVNDPPVVAAPAADISVDEDAADTSIDLSTVFSDVDTASNGDSLTFAAASQYPGLVSVALSGAALTLDYQDNQYGAAEITLTATDTAGEPVTHQFTATVNAVNDAPWANGQPVSVVAGAARTIILEYGDVETDQAELQVEFSTPSYGELSPNLPNVTYTAQAGFSGEDSFTYTITDPQGLPVTATIHITVIPASSGSITGQVFDDADADGQLELENGETGLAGVTVQMQDASGSVITTLTASDGTYAFTGLTGGTYQVRQVVEVGRVQTTPDPADIPLAEAQTVTGIRFGSVVSADLKVNMTVNTSGKTIIYGITATNDGPSDAVDALLTDPRPEGVSHISVMTTAGTCNNDKTLTCNFGTLTPGQSVTVIIEVRRINTKVAIVNTATVTSSTFDIDPADNSSAVTVQ